MEGHCTDAVSTSGCEWMGTVSPGTGMTQGQESWGGVSTKDRVPRYSAECREKLTRMNTEKKDRGLPGGNGVGGAAF